MISVLHMDLWNAWSSHRVVRLVLYASRDQKQDLLWSGTSTLPPLPQVLRKDVAVIVRVEMQHHVCVIGFRLLYSFHVVRYS